MDSKSALSELKKFQGSRKGAGDYYTQYQQELGVGDAQARSTDIRGLIRNTEGALKGVNASVAGRTRGQGVNEAQRARLEGIERAPIAEELGTLQGSFADEQQNYRDLLSQATTRAGQSYQTDADKLAALESNYNKLFQSEQAAAEQRRWEKEMAERTRQFQEQMAQSDRESARQEAAIRAQYASAASLYNPNFSSTPSGSSSQPKINKTYKNSSGQVIGYETPYQSVLTDAGWKEQEKLWRKEGRSNLQKVFGGIGDLTGWF